MPKITELWAYISVDKNIDDEGIVAALNPRDGSWMPMIAADKARVDSLRPLATAIAIARKIEVKLVKFSVRKEVETISAPVEIPVT